MRKFKTKISISFLIPFLGFFSFLIWQTMVENLWVFSFIFFIVPSYFIHLCLNTYYLIQDGKLLIKAGIFYKKEIAISQIRKISETNDLTSAPAPSFDRLEILYDKFQTVLVSPKEKINFVEALKEVNPEINVNYKKHCR